jgi:D-lactate dehydrogenase (cytochrome)
VLSESRARLITALVAVVGADNISSDPTDLALAGSDLFEWPAAVTPALVLRPGSTEEVAAIVANATTAGLPVVPRGAGLSYTGGVVPTGEALVLDLTRLHQVRIEADDLYAVVGAGCSWDALAALLKPLGLRPMTSPPISGSHSTVGGAASQNLPGSAEGIIGVTVVLADGTIAHTGSSMLPASTPFYRNAGPDLTGLFMGDCGAFGIKTEIVLRLVPDHAVAFAAFAFNDSASLVDAMAQLSRAGVATRCMALDEARGADAMQQVGVAEALRVAWAVASAAGPWHRRVAALAGLARTRAQAPAAWSLYLTVEAPTGPLARRQLALAKRIAAEAGREISPGLLEGLHARPFSVRGMVGPDGERWVPVHGIFALSRAAAAMAAMEAMILVRKPALDALGIRIAWLASAQRSYILFEPMMYWPDALDPLHMKYLSPRNHERFGGRAPNPEARAAVRELRQALRGIMDSHGAVHSQLGRFYPLEADPGSRALLGRLKQALDPDARMNPGSGGFATQAV